MKFFKITEKSSSRRIYVNPQQVISMVEKSDLSEITVVTGQVIVSKETASELFRQIEERL